MFKVVSVSYMREIEAALNASGLTYEMLMQHAGIALAECIAVNKNDFPEDFRITFLIGPGNNGGDGLVAAGHLFDNDIRQIRVYLLKKRDDDLTRNIISKGILTAVAEDDHDGRVLRNMIASADVVVDALFGIGARLPLSAEAKRLLKLVNQVLRERDTARYQRIILDPSRPDGWERLPKVKVIAVDCPSGLDCDSGSVDRDAIVADETITFIAAKRGQFLFPGANYVGRLWLSSAGTTSNSPLLNQVNEGVVTSEWVRQQLPARPLMAHKGDFGRVLVIGGCRQFIGAVALTAMAAYQIGAGLVTIASIPEVIACLAGSLIEPTWWSLPTQDGFIAAEAEEVILKRLHEFDAIIIGPGMGRGAEEFLRRLFSQTRDWPPLLLDADALNIISQSPNTFHIPHNAVITPHLGEMRRLLGEGELPNDRWQLVKTQAQKRGVVLLLKGAHTMIGDTTGRVVVLPFKNPALAKAGTGDVLAGVIGGLLAQGVAPFEAAAMGAYIHGLAGEIASRQTHPRSLLAHQVGQALSIALSHLED